MNSEEFNKALASGIKFIASQQQSDGSFISYTSQNTHLFKENTVCQTTFFPSLIGLSLSDMNHESARSIVLKTSNWLLKQRSSDWSFNYWNRSSNETRDRPYPDDLDDTFCALALLSKAKPEILTGSVLASVAHLLFVSENKTGGPYKTWLVSAQSGLEWQDVDLAVNSNIAYFLSLRNIVLPGVTQYIEESIKTQNLYSPYYPGSIPVIYFISRWYKGKINVELNEQILSTKKGNFWGSAHNAALCISSLLRNGYSPKQLSSAINYLLKTQKTNGSWKAAAFNIDLRNSSSTVFMGSASLTTAFCLEALDLYNKSIEQVDISKINSQKKLPTYYDSVISQAMIKVNSINGIELKQGVTDILKLTIDKDKDKQIILLPYLLAKAGKLIIKQQFLQKLSMVSLWGWMSYTIYDSLIDGHRGRLLLPAANFCYRQMLAEIDNISIKNRKFQKEAMEIIDKMDSAGAWEILNCRVNINSQIAEITKLPDYKNYWQLADRAFGHAIPSLGVLYILGFNKSSYQATALRKFFKHYLIARQLNDEAHDWEEDLNRGHINVVGAMIIKQKIKEKLAEVLYLEEEIDDLRNIMWEKVILKLNHKVNYHIGKARNRLLDLSTDFNIDDLENMLIPVEKATSQALEDRKQTLSFIDAL